MLIHRIEFKPADIVDDLSGSPDTSGGNEVGVGFELHIRLRLGVCFGLGVSNGDGVMHGRRLRFRFRHGLRATSVVIIVTHRVIAIPAVIAIGRQTKSMLQVVVTSHLLDNNGGLSVAPIVCVGVPALGLAATVRPLEVPIAAVQTFVATSSHAAVRHFGQVLVRWI